jgi:Arc/MetJ-type ribon-helix-helix transcriptional regulator
MAEQATLTLHLSPELQKRIEAAVEIGGYTDAEAYLKALVEDDAPLTKAELLAGLRESLHQAVTGQVHPIEELWADLEAETNNDAR